MICQFKSTENKWELMGRILQSMVLLIMQNNSNTIGIVKLGKETLKQRSPQTIRKMPDSIISNTINTT